MDENTPTGPGGEDSLRPGLQTVHVADTEVAKAQVEASSDPLPDTALPELSPGTLIHDRFEVIHFLGRGGFGAVFLARDLQLGRQVAIKVVATRRGRLTPDDYALFDKEAKATARLNHPNIVTVHDWGVWEGSPYLVLERLRGETLADRIADQRRLTPVEAVSIGVQVVRAVEHAHNAGVLHLDLKPHNVFCTDDGHVKVLDFGIAHLELTSSNPSTLQESPDGSKPRNTTAPSGGTPGYMAPEQWVGTAVNERTDLFGIGVVLFEMLAGRLPFRPAQFTPQPRLADAATGVPAELDALVKRCLAEDDTERPANAGDVLDVLLSLERALAYEASPTEQPYRFLEPFTEDDSGWFFGRARETSRLRGMLATRPIVGLLGPSGAGKSSLVRAGLLPLLRLESPPWAVLRLRPGSSPLQALQQRLGQIGIEVTARQIRETPGVVGQRLREYARRESRRVLIFVDQLEEMYQVSDAGVRRSFASALLSAADDPEEPLRLVIAIRDDFLTRMSDDPELRLQLVANSVYLDPPGSAEMIEAIQGPARRLGYSFDEGLAEAMVEELGNELAPLPLLQLAASRLWDGRDPDARRLSGAVLEEIGGVSGVLAAHANEVVRRLGGREEMAIARLLLCSLVTADDTKRSRLRQALLAQGGDRAKTVRVLDHLVRGRLVTSSSSESGEVIELAHESLLRGWDLLRTWLDAQQETRRYRERLSHEAAHWTQEGRPPHLLWGGRRLREELRRQKDYEAALEPAERAFLDASRRRRRAGRWRTMSLGVVAVSAVAALVTLLVGRSTALCGGGAGRMAGIWDREKKEQVRAAFLATGKQFARDVWRGVERQLDRYKHGWISMHESACKATRVRGDQSYALLDLRMDCLASRRRELGELVAVFTSADAKIVEKAVASAGSLSALSRCADTRVLLARVKPPSDPRSRARADEIRSTVARAKALHRAGKPHQSLRLAEKAVGQARRLGYPPLLAWALEERGLAQSGEGDEKAAADSFEEAVWAAEAGGDDEAATRASARLVGFPQQRPSKLWPRHAEALLQKLGSSGPIAALLERSWATRLSFHGKYRQAVSRARRAHELWEQARGAGSLEAARSLRLIGRYLLRAGDPAKAMAPAQRAYEIRLQALGPSHPLVAASLGDLAVIATYRADYATAIKYSGRALAIIERAFGPQHPQAAVQLHNLGGLYSRIGDYAKAESLLRRALAISERHGGPNDLGVGTTLADLGGALLQGDKPLVAIPLLERSLRIRTRVLGERHDAVAHSLTTLGSAYGQVHQPRKALALHRRALRIYLKTVGPDHISSLAALDSIGNELRKLRRYREAASYHERSLRGGRKTLGKHHPFLAHFVMSLGLVFEKQGKLKKAMNRYREAEKILGKGNRRGPQHASLLTKIGRVLLKLKHPRRAARVLEQGLSIHKALVGSRADLADTRFALARALAALPKGVQRAERLAARSLDDLRRLGAAHAKEAREIDEWLKRLRRRRRRHPQ